MVNDLREEITILNGKINSADSLNMKQVLNEMAEMKKTVEKIEKRFQAQKPPEQPKNGTRGERTARILKLPGLSKALKG